MSDTALTVVEAALPARPAELMVNDDRRTLLRNAIMKGATDAQVDLIVQIGNRYGLDPLLGHIVLIDGKPFVTHKGLFHIAHASGQFDGYETTYGTDALGDYCQCLIYRKDMSRPLSGRIYVAEYNSKRGAWAQYPRAMAAKVAESFVLRRAFDVSLTSEDEMSHAASETPQSTPRSDPRARYSPAHPDVFGQTPPPSLPAPREAAPTGPARPQGAGARVTGVVSAIIDHLNSLDATAKKAFTSQMRAEFGTSMIKDLRPEQAQRIYDSIFGRADGGGIEEVGGALADTATGEVLDDPFADAPEPGGEGAS